MRQSPDPLKLLLISICSVLVVTRCAVADDTTLEEIVVHGELRSSALDDTASSVSVITLSNRQAGTLNHLEEVLSQAPNVNFSSGASRARFFQIRGIGERGQFSEPLNPSVGLLLDGVDMSGVGTAATLFDIEQVEVFRGSVRTRQTQHVFGDVIGRHLLRDRRELHQTSLAPVALDLHLDRVAHPAKGLQRPVAGLEAGLR